MVKIDKIRDQLRDILIKVAYDGMDCERGNLTRADVKGKIDWRIDEILALPELAKMYRKALLPGESVEIEIPFRVKEEIKE